MPEGQLLEFSRLTKRFGAVHAVDELTARVEPGAVTGFLGPNGAGKTTTLRMLLGLIRPTSGTATIGGVPYSKLSRPLQTVGAVLEASSFHPGRTGANHLKIYAQAAGLPSSRIEATLELVGLTDAAGRKVGGYSLGMRQRLGLAYALLGDPGVLVLDEPANGLDPEGIKWLRGFLQQLAREGRTVLVSSHLLTEVQQTADAVLILSRGRRVFNGSIADLVDPSEQATIVDSEDRAGLVKALQAAGIESAVLRSGVTVRGADPAEVGRAAAAAGVALTALQRRGPALEEVFLDLVSGVRVHPSADASNDGLAQAPAFAGMAAGAAAASAPVPEASPVVEVHEPEPVIETPEAAPETSAEEPAPEEAPAEDPHAFLAEHLRPGVKPAPEPAAVTGVTALAALGLHSAAADGAESDATADRSEDGDPLAWIAAAETETARRPPADEPTDAGAPEDADSFQPEWTTDSESAGAAFAVASTGVIDIVPLGATQPGQGTDAGAGDEPTGDVQAGGAAADEPIGAEAPSDEPAGEEPAGEDEPEPGPLGDHDVEETGPEGEAPESGGDLDEDDLGEDDFDEDESLTDQIRSAYVTHSAHAGEDEKTDSDVAADAFFAAFDASLGQPAEPVTEPVEPEDSVGKDSEPARDGGDSEPDHDRLKHVPDGQMHDPDPDRPRDDDGSHHTPDEEGDAQ